MDSGRKTASRQIVSRPRGGHYGNQAKEISPESEVPNPCERRRQALKGLLTFEFIFSFDYGGNCMVHTHLIKVNQNVAIPARPRNPCNFGSPLVIRPVHDFVQMTPVLPEREAINY